MSQTCVMRKEMRHAQGKRYEWLYWLTLLVAALLAGERSCVGLVHWLVQHKDELVEALQPNRSHGRLRTTHPGKSGAHWAPPQ
jgi:hypothetical protein